MQIMISILQNFQILKIRQSAMQRNLALTLAHQLTSVPFEVLWIPRSETLCICGMNSCMYTAHNFVYMAVYDLEIKIISLFQCFGFFYDFKIFLDKISGLYT